MKTVSLFIILFLLAGSINHLHAQEKSTALALGLSMGVPLLSYCAFEMCRLPPTGLWITSVFITPSLGHFYAGQWGRGILFIGLRTSILLGTYVALISNARASYYNYIEEGIYESLGIALIGLSLCGAVTLIDWAFVPSSVQKYNERFQIEPEINLHNGSYGLGISYRF